MKTAFLFSGQGAQYVGMGKALYDNYPQAKAVFDQMELDFDVKTLCFEGPNEQLQDTAYAQSCIFTVSCAVAEVLKAHGIQADGCAGLSLGEYSAYAYAGSFSYRDGALLTRERGKLMAHSLPQGSSGMAAIMMLEEAAIQKACEQVAAEGYGVCEIANYNCPGQIVITGHMEAVKRGMELCLEMGARRCVPLQVSGAFHSSLLKDAAHTLGEVLDQYTIRDASLPIYNNISGTVEKGPIKDILMKQISNSVYFEQTIQHMYADGYRRFIEVGPGTAVSSFVKKTLKGKADIQILHVENEATLQSVLQAQEA